MQLIKKYLFYKKKEILVYFLLLLSIETIFLLFHLPQEALFYPFLIWIVIVSVHLILDYYRAKEAYLFWKRIEDSIEEMPVSHSLQEEAFIETIYNLEQKLISQKNESLKKEQEQMDYYTLWVHQMKTPIASMRLHLQNEQSAFSRQLLIELNRIEQYTNMVLTFLRLDSSSTDYVIRKVDVDSVLKSVVRKFSTEFINRKLSFSYEVESYSVLTDEKWLSFVFEQILSNALKYTRSGKITISQNKNVICVQDTGIGIDPSDLSRVFEKGYTGFNGRLDKKASGIGLYLVKRICDNLHHSIWIESKVGEGTCVYIRFHEEKIGIE